MRRTRRSHPLLAAVAVSALTAGVARGQTPQPPPAEAEPSVTQTTASPDAAPTPPPPAAASAPPPAAAPAPPPAAPAPARPIAPPTYAAPYPNAYPYPYAPWPSWYPPPPGYSQPPPPAARAPVIVTAAPTPPPGSTRVPAEDPQADRGVLAPTAYTHPKGTFYFSDYEVALLQIGYAITDDTQLSLTGLPPLGEERVVFLDLTLKTMLHRGGLVRVAALGSTSGLAAKEIGVLGVGRVGGVVQLCLERTCGSSVSLGSDITLAGILLMANSAGGIFRVSRTVSFLAELDTLVPLGKDAGQINGGIAAGGLRLSGTSWGLDLSLLRVLGSDGATLPLITLSYRSTAAFTPAAP
ncbi:MAG TPA: hypothetical protein VHK47_20110 [Polyangia bacterium]|nr:hypothetical protein [Polyangia bacterium]